MCVQYHREVGDRKFMLYKNEILLQSEPIQNSKTPLENSSISNYLDFEIEEIQCSKTHFERMATVNKNLTK